VGFHVLEKSPGAFWQLEIEQRFVAVRSGVSVRDRQTEDNSCQLSRLYTLDLGTGDTLSARSKQLFGKRMARLADIATSGRSGSAP
jgi:hypothetical protein